MKAQTRSVAKGYFHLYVFGYINSSMQTLTFNCVH